MATLDNKNFNTADTAMADLIINQLPDGSYASLGKNHKVYLYNNELYLVRVDDDTKVVITKGTAASFGSTVLANGQIVAVETDKGLRIKVGDGTTAFGSLKYADEDYITSVDSAIREWATSQIEALQADIDKKVASVAAGDASVSIGGTATAPTVSAKLSADANNALELAADGLKVVIPDAAEYTIEKAAESGDYAAIYTLKKDGVQVGASINIPKDMVVESGAVVENPAGQAAGTYIKLVLQNVAEPLYINVGSLIEYVTSGSANGDMVVVSVSEDHKVTATITDGTITLAKLTSDVQAKINQAHTHANATELDKIADGDVAKWNAAQANAEATAASALATAKSELEGKINTAKTEANEYADGLNTAMDTRVKAVEAKAHEHTNKAELDKVASGDVTKWNTAVVDLETLSARHDEEMTAVEEAVAAKTKVIIRTWTAADMA